MSAACPVAIKCTENAACKAGLGEGVAVGSGGKGGGGEGVAGGGSDVQLTLIHCSQMPREKISTAELVGTRSGSRR